MRRRSLRPRTTLAMWCLRGGAAYALVLTCDLLACTPDQEAGSPPKNGSVSSSQERGGGGDDDDDDTTNKSDTTKAGSAKTKRSCRDACMQGNRAARILTAWEACVTACGRDADCLQGCDDGWTESCTGMTACETLDHCLEGCPD